MKIAIAICQDTANKSHMKVTEVREDGNTTQNNANANWGASACS